MYSLPVLGLFVVTAHLARSASGEMMFGSASDSSSVGLSDDCPVAVAPNRSGSCYCTTLMDIHCRDLDAVPEFLPFGSSFYGLHITRQSIVEITPEAFRNLRVTTILMNFNPIGQRLDLQAFVGLETVLQELQLGGCQIPRLREGFLTGMEELRYLHLWANLLTRIPPGVFKEATNLRELLLWGNAIDNLDDNSFAGLWNLRRLDLDRNKISTLKQDTFRHLLELEVLHLGENNINILYGETFLHMEKLKVLNLDGNRISIILPNAFGGLSNLLNLILSQNSIEYIPDHAFDNLHNLTGLWLHENSLQYIWKTTFAGLHSLRQIHLSRNLIKHLPIGAFHQSPELRHLFLEDNQFLSLRRCPLENPDRLRTLSLVGNPVECNCTLVWTLELVQKQGTTIWGNSCMHKLSGKEARNDRNRYPVNRYHQLLASCTFEHDDCSRE